MTRPERASNCPPAPPRTHIDSVGGVKGQDMRGELRRGRPPEKPRRRFDNDNLPAHGACRGRDFEPDEASAENRQAPRRPQQFPQTRRVARSPEHDHVVRIAVHSGTATGARAGCKHEPTIGQAPARSQLEGVLAPPDGDGRVADVYADPGLLEPVGSPVVLHRLMRILEERLG